jgi:hypothetical protein
MTALFPTFGNFLQRAKQFLATDITPLWERFLEICETDEERYINEFRSKGAEDFDCFGFGSFR